MSQLDKRVTKFIGRVSRLQSCCSRIERQYDAGRLQVTDVELVYTSSFLSVCSLWESLLEEILIEVVCGDESDQRGNTRLASFRNRTALKNLLLFPNKDYISIPNLKRAEELASLFVVNGRPFSLIGEANKTHIQQAALIRNAIAHQSSHAVKKFREKVPGVASMPASKRTPGAFLRHEFRLSPKQRRYELYYASFKSSASEISLAW